MEKLKKELYKCKLEIELYKCKLEIELYKSKLEHKLKNMKLIKINEKDLFAYTTLNAQIDSVYKRVISEIKTGKKITHWIWYFFPTERPGISDPYKTYITKETAKLLIDNQKWLDVHMKINNLLLINSTFFPEIDLGRIKYFIKFWKENTILFDKIELNGYLNNLQKIAPN